jgi:predicted Zn-dependent protease
VAPPPWRPVALGGVVRIAGAVAALAVAAWFGLGVYQAHNADAAREAIGRLPDPTAAQTERIRAELDRAATLNPDRGITLLRARAAFQQPDLPRAYRLIQQVTRAEPDNIEAWALLAFATVNHHADALNRAAEAQVRRLGPPVPAP